MSVATPTREEWLAERMTGIGASESAAVLGESPWQSAMGVWAEKTGNAEPDDLSANEAVAWGLRLEAPIAEAYAEATGEEVTLWPRYTIARHPEYPWLYATPDATIAPRRNMQIKTAGAFVAAEWQNGPPLHYEIQVQHEMAARELEQTTLVVLIGGQKLRWFDVERNDRFLDAMIPKLAAFWELVQSGTMPPVDDSLATAKVLAKLHPDDDGTVVDLSGDEELADYHDRLGKARSMKKLAEAMEQEAKNHIRAAMGKSTYAMLPDGVTYSLRTQTRPAHDVMESTFRVLRSVKKLPKTHGAIVAPATKSIGDESNGDNS